MSILEPNFEEADGLGIKFLYEQNPELRFQAKINQLENKMSKNLTCNFVLTSRGKQPWEPARPLVSIRL